MRSLNSIFFRKSAAIFRNDWDEITVPIAILSIEGMTFIQLIEAEWRMYASVI